MMKIMKFMFGKMDSKRKGITPVIAIVLLLMMTVAAAGMAYVWIMSLQEDVRVIADEGLNDMKIMASVSLSFEAVHNKSTNLIEFTLRNTGKHGFSSGELNQFIVYTNKVEDTTASAAVATCSAAGGNLNELGGTCTVLTGTDFPTEPGRDNAVLIEITTPFKEKKFVYNCIIDRKGKTYC